MSADFAIITIRQDEYEAVAERFNPTIYRDGNEHTYGFGHVKTMGGQDCTVAIARCTDQGNDASQQLAHAMISEFAPQLLLVVGIAGAVPDTDFTLGDVIISSRILNFDVNAYKAGEIEWDVRGGIHPQVSEIAASLPIYRDLMKGWNYKSNIRIARPTVDPTRIDFDGSPPESWQKKIMQTLKWHFGSPIQRPPTPLFISGSIASSNSLVRDTAILTQWLQNARSIRAVEMEAAGVFQAAQQPQRHYPVMAIRGISDIVGLVRDPAWTRYACHSAAAFTYAFIRAGIVNSRTKSVDSSSVQTQADVHAQKGTVQSSQTTSPLPVYISYVESDEELRLKLEKHLVMLKRQGLISTWHSRQASAGLDKDDEVNNNINKARLILLLVSQEFIASDYCYEKEMTNAMDHHAKGTARVIPILLRDADWRYTPFGNLQALPRDYKPIASRKDQDSTLVKIVEEIRQICDQLRGTKHTT